MYGVRIIETINDLEVVSVGLPRNFGFVNEQFDYELLEVDEQCGAFPYTVGDYLFVLKELGLLAEHYCGAAVKFFSEEEIHFGGITVTADDDGLEEVISYLLSKGVPETEIDETLA